MSRSSRLAAVVLTVVVASGVLVAARQTAPADQGSTRVLATAERDVRAWDDRVSKLQGTRELRVRNVQADTLIPGRQHERLDQYYNGVRVFGGEVVRDTDGQGALAVTASLYTGIAIDVTPALSQADATAVFQRETGAAPDARVTTELVVLPRSDGSFALAYRTTGFARHQLPVLLVNAKTGAVELRYNNLQKQQATAMLGTGVLGSEGLVSSDQKKVSVTQQGTTFVAWDQMRPVTIKTFDLKGNVTRVDQMVSGQASPTSGDLASNTAATWQDPVVVDGHTYLGWTYDYFYKRHGWKGFDGGNGRQVLSIVHPAYRANMESYKWDDVADYYTNSFFCGGCGGAQEDLLVFGEGLPARYYIASTGQYVDYFVASLDTVAHEYTHGITTYTSNLTYMDESGALDEAFSDIMGIGVDFYYETAGSGLRQADYIEGKDNWRAYISGSINGLRSMANPGLFGDPDNYSRRYTGTDDNGGVHTNAAIVEHAFYLAIEGGTNRTSGLTVQGVGSANRQQIERVFFEAFTSLTSNATFSLARAKTIQAARDLYGSTSAAVTAVTQAWNAVGVL